MEEETSELTINKDAPSTSTTSLDDPVVLAVDEHDDGSLVMDQSMATETEGSIHQRSLDQTQTNDDDTDDVLTMTAQALIHAEEKVNTLQSQNMDMIQKLDELEQSMSFVDENDNDDDDRGSGSGDNNDNTISARRNIQELVRLKSEQSLVETDLAMAEHQARRLQKEYDEQKIMASNFLSSSFRSLPPMSTISSSSPTRALLSSPMRKPSSIRSLTTGNIIGKAFSFDDRLVGGDSPAVGTTEEIKNPIPFRGSDACQKLNTAGDTVSNASSENSDSQSSDEEEEEDESEDDSSDEDKNDDNSSFHDYVDNENPSEGDPILVPMELDHEAEDDVEEEIEAEAALIVSQELQEASKNVDLEGKLTESQQIEALQIAEEVLQTVTASEVDEIKPLHEPDVSNVETEEETVEAPRSTENSNPLLLESEQTTEEEEEALKEKQTQQMEKLATQQLEEDKGGSKKVDDAVAVELTERDMDANEKDASNDEVKAVVKSIVEESIDVAVHVQETSKENRDDAPIQIKEDENKSNDEQETHFQAKEKSHSALEPKQDECEESVESSLVSVVNKQRETQRLTQLLDGQEECEVDDLNHNNSINKSDVPKNDGSSLVSLVKREWETERLEELMEGQEECEDDETSNNDKCDEDELPQGNGKIMKDDETQHDGCGGEKSLSNQPLSASLKPEDARWEIQTLVTDIVQHDSEHTRESMKMMLELHGRNDNCEDENLVNKHNVDGTDGKGDGKCDDDEIMAESDNNRFEKVTQFYYNSLQPARDGHDAEKDASEELNTTTDVPSSSYRYADEDISTIKDVVREEEETGDITNDAVEEESGEVTNVAVEEDGGDITDELKEPTCDKVVTDNATTQELDEYNRAKAKEEIEVASPVLVATADLTPAEEPTKIVLPLLEASVKKEFLMASPSEPSIPNPATSSPERFSKVIELYYTADHEESAPPPPPTRLSSLTMTASNDSADRMKASTTATTTSGNVIETSLSFDTNIDDGFKYADDGVRLLRTVREGDDVVLTSSDNEIIDNKEASDEGASAIDRNQIEGERERDGFKQNVLKEADDEQEKDCNDEENISLSEVEREEKHVAMEDSYEEDMKTNAIIDVQQEELLHELEDRIWEKDQIDNVEEQIRESIEIEETNAAIEDEAEKEEGLTQPTEEKRVDVGSEKVSSPLQSAVELKEASIPTETPAALDIKESSSKELTEEEHTLGSIEVFTSSDTLSKYETASTDVEEKNVFRETNDALVEKDNQNLNSGDDKKDNKLNIFLSIDHTENEILTKPSDTVAPYEEEAHEALTGFEVGGPSLQADEIIISEKKVTDKVDEEAEKVLTMHLSESNNKVNEEDHTETEVMSCSNSKTPSERHHMTRESCDLDKAEQITHDSVSALTTNQDETPDSVGDSSCQTKSEEHKQENALKAPQSVMEAMPANSQVHGGKEEGANQGDSDLATSVAVSSQNDYPIKPSTAEKVNVPLASKTAVESNVTKPSIKSFSHAEKMSKPSGGKKGLFKSVAKGWNKLKKGGSSKSYKAST